MLSSAEIIHTYIHVYTNTLAQSVSIFFKSSAFFASFETAFFWFFFLCQHFFSFSFSSLHFIVASFCFGFCFRHFFFVRFLLSRIYRYFVSCNAVFVARYIQTQYLSVSVVVVYTLCVSIGRWSVDRSLRAVQNVWFFLFTREERCWISRDRCLYIWAFCCCRPFVHVYRCMCVCCWCP